MENGYYWAVGLGDREQSTIVEVRDCPINDGEQQVCMMGVEYDWPLDIFTHRTGWKIIGEKLKPPI